MRSLSQQTKSIIAFNTTAISTDAIHNGVAFDISGIAGNGAELEIDIFTGVRSAGKIALQDIQFSDDNTFATGVESMTISDIQHFIKMNDANISDAIAQTEISAANTFVKIGVHIIKNKKYARIRLVSSSSAGLTVSAIARMTQGRLPA